MRVISFEAEHFRNLQSIRVEPCDGINIICGENGQGKTNLLEGIGLMNGARSFRRARSEQLIRQGQDFAKLSMAFFSEDREQEAKIVITKEKKEAVINGVKQQAASSLIGKFCTVVFSPDTMALISGGESERRRFLDGAISQIFPRFVFTAVEFNRLLAHRNALLKKCGENHALTATLDAWDERLARSGAELSRQRREYVERLRPLAAKTYEGISSSREPLHINFVCEYAKEEESDKYQSYYLSKLTQMRGSDIRVGFTQSGPHRDELAIEINGRNARAYGSQGQKRSAVLALKLAEAELLGGSVGGTPVALLDDVMSELDAGRQEYLLNRLGGWQVFITCCDPSPLRLMDKGKVFGIENGELRVEN